jgi:hypothetical protein
VSKGQENYGRFNVKITKTGKDGQLTLRSVKVQNTEVKMHTANIYLLLLCLDKFRRYHVQLYN